MAGLTRKTRQSNTDELVSVSTLVLWGSVEICKLYSNEVIFLL